MSKKGYYRYKDPHAAMVKNNEYVKEKYSLFSFRLDNEKDKDLIDEIRSRDCSLPDLIRKWRDTAK